MTINSRPEGSGRDLQIDDEPRVTKKQRRQRPSHSCAECRRLKMKCDRKVPCSNCVRRRRVEFCTPAPSRFVAHNPPEKVRRSDVRPVQRQDSQPPTIPEESGGFSPTSLDLGHQPLRQERLAHHNGTSQRDTPSCTLNYLDPTPSQQRNLTTRRGDFEQLAVLARALQSAPVHTSPLAASDQGAGSENNEPNRPSGLSHRSSISQTVGESGSYGTLMLGKGGRSKYLGPTAGSEWLRETEAQDGAESPPLTRAPSPKIPQASAAFQTPPIAFPFNASAAHISTRELLSRLPPKEEAETLVESYYRYCSWHHDVAPKGGFQKTFDRVYHLVDAVVMTPSVNPQEVALVFIILAHGTMFNIEMPNYDPSAEEWLHLSEQALVKGHFLSNNMVPGLQTLHLMAHLHLMLDKGGRGDNAWPLWGLVMRLIQAMGMHRDGTRWNLPPDIVEERRKVFWECNSADIFQAHCFSRPSAINPEHCDVGFPSEPPNANGEKSYSILRFELSQLSSEILNMAMKVQQPAYSAVIDLDLRLAEFEQALPFSIRSRAALLAMPSRYPQFEAAIEVSPEPSQRLILKSFQQMNLALNISETIINLHRPYYAKALYADNGDSVKSVYALSFLTVIERCAIIITLVNDIHTRFPAVSTRQWNLWFHVFGSALCLGTLVLRDPANPMATFVLTQLDMAISLFTSLIQHGANTPRYCRNLQWLMKLRSRASTKISAVSNAHSSHSQRDNQQETGRDRQGSEDVELLGWRTRLIERADKHIIWTIQHGEASGAAVDTGSNPSPDDQNFGLGFLNPGFADITTSIPDFAVTDGLGLVQGQDFWDPMLLQDILDAPAPHG
ncbi:hypothetical protein BDW74DRAFT_187209 [Aspergillus multicolor]|uniref:uncharacterized protein n=1 Tax=Aspergillus multicolor TaxID=41759 RepID=UPI003CCDB382